MNFSKLLIYLQIFRKKKNQGTRGFNKKGSDFDDIQNQSARKILILKHVLNFTIFYNLEIVSVLDI